LRVLYFFRVYPRAFNTYHAASADAGPVDWQIQLAEFNLVSRIFLVNTIRQFRLYQTADDLQTWFGESATEPAVRGEVLRVLNSILKVMDNAELVYNDTNCDKSTFAFVFPTGYMGIIDPNSTMPRISSNPEGQPLVYVCPRMLSPPIFEAVQAFVHESSHHATAYTQDVIDCEDVRYLWLKTSQLAKIAGNDCKALFGSEADLPRFRIGGYSCNVTGDRLHAALDLQASPSVKSMDRSLLYGMDILRFSEDGKLVLCKVEEMEDYASSSAELSMWGCNNAYGQEMCKELAEKDPFKARLNADNFGYYVMDAGSEGFGVLREKLTS